MVKGNFSSQDPQSQSQNKQFVHFRGRGRGNRAILSGYKDGFTGVGTVVDVAGGTGAAMVEIVKAHPRRIGINLDLPHVIAAAPVYAGVSHVPGNMFETIRNADAVFMKVRWLNY
ncbi:hypothetical protein U1Q18_025179 [Sarracenia purpurea var. burkii]